MSRILRRMPSPSMVVACIALAVALGGTSYAAITLPRNSVGTNQLRKDSVTATKLATKSVGPRKLQNNAVGDPNVKADALTGAKINEATLARFLRPPTRRLSPGTRSDASSPPSHPVPLRQRS